MQPIVASIVLGLLVLPAAALSGELEITDAWIRALPPTQPSTAAYLTVHNRGEQAAVISAGSAEGAGRMVVQGRGKGAM